MMNLKGNPFYLTDEDIDWVNVTFIYDGSRKVGSAFLPARHA